MLQVPNMERYSKKELDAIIETLELPADAIELMAISPTRFYVDESYQRNPRKRLNTLKKIADEFNPIRLGVFHVHVREDGRIAVIDGAGRAYVMTELLKINPPVLCINHKHIKTVKEEADWFIKLNPPTVRKVTPADKFKAAVVAGDPYCTRINNAARKGDLHVGASHVDGISVQAAEVLDHLSALTVVGKIKHMGWKMFKPTGPMLIAIGALVFSAQDDIDYDRLAKVLTKNPPDTLVGMLKNTFGWPHSRDIAPRFAQVLVELYNKGLHADGRKKIDPDWTRVNELLTRHPFNDRWGGIKK